MRKEIIVVAIGLAACGGAKAKNDSVARDSTIVPGPPAVAPTQAESAGPRPRASATGALSTSNLPKPDTRPHTTPRLEVSTDTVRGTVSVVGSDRSRHVTIVPPGGGRRIEVTGSLAALIGHQAGADVWVSGAASGTTIEAGRFVVRMVDGAPAIDGTLKTEGSMLFIITADGTRTRITAPPPPLVGHDGNRVWITGDPSRGVEAFGFIDPPR